MAGLGESEGKVQRQEQTLVAVGVSWKELLFVDQREMNGN